MDQDVRLVWPKPVLLHLRDKLLWQGVMEISGIHGENQQLINCKMTTNSICYDTLQNRDLSPQHWPQKMSVKIYPRDILDPILRQLIPYASFVDFQLLMDNAQSISMLRNLLMTNNNFAIVQPVTIVQPVDEWNSPQCRLKGFILCGDSTQNAQFLGWIHLYQDKFIKIVQQITQSVPQILPDGEQQMQVPLQKSFEQQKAHTSSQQQAKPQPQQDLTGGSDITEDDREDAKKLLYEAMEKGYVTSQHVVIILVGIAGSGKSSFKRVVLGLPPEETRVSTPVAEAAIRNISISRAVVGDSDSVKWEVVTSEELLTMLADAIKEVGEPQEPARTTPTSTSSLSSNYNIGADLIDDPSELRDLRASGPSLSEKQNSKDGEEPLEFKDDPLLPLISKSRGSRRLLGVHWVYIIDTGGQPQFLQLLPAFIKNVSSCVCLLRLDQNLDDKPLVKYFDQSGKQCGEPYPSEHTNLQVIESCVCTIHSRSCLNSDESPNCFIVGTHLDEYEKRANSESIEEKNERLLEKLSDPQLEQSLRFYRSGDDTEKLIFPLNCKNPEEPDQNVAAEFRKCVMSCSSEPEIKIPLAWFVLEERICQHAVKQNVAYVRKATCSKIASQLHMSQKIFQAALDHLLKLNIFRCYSSLPDLIFCDTQVVLLKLTELVQHSFQLRRATIFGISGEDINFKNEGIITIKFLSANRFSSFYSDLFTPECFLKILRELLAIADMQMGKFFMPCLLKQLSENEICKYRSSSKSLSTLLIHLGGGCLPNGLFTSLVASLKNSHGWELGYGGPRRKPICLYQNCVLFKIPGNFPGTVTLIASFKCLEVHVDCSIEARVDSICAKVLSNVRSGLKSSWRVLYPGEISFKLAFFCSSCSCSPYSSDEIERHYADISECGEYEMCSLHPSKGMTLSESKLRWLKSTNFITAVGKPTITPTATQQSLVVAEATTQQLSSDYQIYLSFLPDMVTPYLDKMLDWDSEGVDKDLSEIAKHMWKWEELLAVPFELTSVDIEDIRDKKSPELQRREVLRKWNGCHATYRKLLEVFVDTKHAEGAKAVCDILKRKGSI